jgi:DNA polymerase I-like protein with 3'-5' exonuclease and polymerase domains
LGYVDWSQQEFGIAASMSGDINMMTAYRSGDPYLAFAKQAGAVPQRATKQTHNAEREQFKASAIAVLYGMGEQSLALRINQSVTRAQQLLDLHKKTYRTFWKFLDNVLNEARLGGRLWTAFGWQIITRGATNDRSLCNFPIQATAAEMLRIACIMLVDAGIKVCAPIHDALLIEAPLDRLEADVIHTQIIMREASRVVLNGFELDSEVKIVRYPDRYVDDRGITMWNRIMTLLNEPTYAVACSGSVTYPPTATSGTRPIF